MKIYIASSARNLHAVQLLRDLLIGQGHNILDWTVLAPPLADSLTVEERRKALDSDERGDIYTFCEQSCRQAELLIYLGPSGQDAACEVGMGYAAGRPVIGLAAPTEKPGLILTRAVNIWVRDVRACLELVERLEKTGSLDEGTSKNGHF